MTMAAKRENIVAGTLGGAMVLAVLAVFFASHYQALLHPGAVQSAAVQANPNTLAFPSVEEMCKAQGVPEGAAMDSCKTDENAAGEFVIAWMGLNNFLANGEIDISAIELAGELGADPGNPLNDPDPALDPSAGLDPTLALPNTDADIDPTTGLPLDQDFQTPAEIAMYCLSNSMDWLQIHDCISRYDPSTRFTGGF
jgi:hypothetical protein